ncbi:MAG: excisionase family DNA-binding protein [Chloroflexi bacterium]|nr:excisionase family DNA-binding protein [Chloroflexota bacterium]
MVKRPSAQIIDLALDSVDTSRLHTVRETASLINLSTDYLRDLINMGRVEAVKPFGGHLRIYPNEVKRLLRSMLTDGEIPS